MSVARERMRLLRAEIVTRAVAFALIGAVFLAYVFFSFPFDSDLRGQDIEAYWSAAERLRLGEDPYVPKILPYTYAPWFAFVWVPLTLLPRELVEAGWLALLLAAVAWLTYPLLRSAAGVAIALLIVPQVIEYAWIGNVDVLMLCGLALVSTRAGPVLVGLAASLKITPILFVAYYLHRREWRRALVALGVAAVLWLPALAFDLSTFGEAGYDATTPYSLMTLGPLAWFVGNGLIIGAVAWLAWRDSRYSLLASSVAAMLANPRLNLYNLGYLLVPAREGSKLPPSARQPGSALRSRSG